MDFRGVTWAVVCAGAMACGATDSEVFQGEPSGGRSGAAGDASAAAPGEAGAEAGGASGSSGSAGGGNAAAGSGRGGAGGDGGACSTLTAERAAPTVLLLVDASSSMFENQAAVWNLLFEALMGDGGVVATLEDQVRFGFTAFRGQQMPLQSESDPTCALLTEVDAALGNHAAIREPYAGIAAEYNPLAPPWQTPSGHALRRATAALDALDAPGTKHLLFVTDGNPDTCAIANPQCGQDLSVAAVQDAHALGIETLVVGVGDILSGSLNSGCTPTWPCDEVHLQDLANAGAGLPVARPGDEYLLSPCFTVGGQMALTAEYAAGAVTRNAPYHAGESVEALRSELVAALGDVAGCSFALSDAVSDPTRGSVTVDGAAVPFDGPNGFELDASGTRLTLRGTACDRVRTGAALELNFPCDALGAR